MSWLAATPGTVTTERIAKSFKPAYKFGVEVKGNVIPSLFCLSTLASTENLSRPKIFKGDLFSSLAVMSHSKKPVLL